jgi:hypothetical protein
VRLLADAPSGSSSQARRRVPSSASVSISVIEPGAWGGFAGVASGMTSPDGLIRTGCAGAVQEDRSATRSPVAASTETSE